MPCEASVHVPVGVICLVSKCSSVQTSLVNREAPGFLVPTPEWDVEPAWDQTRS
jgi:hypothetical protein